MASSGLTDRSGARGPAARRRAVRELVVAREFVQGTLDSLAAHIAVLDARGAIIMTNRAWEEFARANGGGPATTIGSSYLAACKGGDADVRSSAAADGLRAIIAGKSSEFTMEYPCHGPGDMRWFQMRAARYEGPGPASVVVAHDDITERVSSERAPLERHVETLRWIGRVQEAFEQERFVLYAQPIIDVRSGELAQRELLLRMRDPSGEIIAPTDFLPVAEQYGLIGDIDRWVIERASEIAAASGAVELNLSARSMGDRTILDYIEQCIRRTGADPRNLVFEITETALVADEAAAAAFADRLHSLGCKLALDDFGTGYGGLTYLKRFPVDFLKIDVEFVRDLPSNPASRYVVEAVATLARAFDLKTVAEGVEDAETLDVLRELGVEYAQGFYIARPALQGLALGSS